MIVFKISLSEERPCNARGKKTGKHPANQSLYAQGGQIRPAVRSEGSNSPNLNANGHEIGKTAKSEGGKKDGTGAQARFFHSGKFDIGKEFGGEYLDPNQLPDIEDFPTIHTD